MSDAFAVAEVTTKKMMKDFIRFPHKLYRNDQYYVPLPNLFIKDSLDPSVNPFFKNGEVACFLATDKHGKVVGRIAAIHNKVHLSIYQDNTGFFGFFDCIDDENVAALLFQNAELWLKQKGLKKMLGPENLTTNDPTGTLTAGFNDSPVFLMPYNYPYYEKLFRANGFAESMSLYSYEASGETLPSAIYQKALSIENRLQQHNIFIRNFTGRNFLTEMKRLNKVYNGVNEDNWGFLPLDEESFLHMAKGLKQVVDKESVLFAEKDGVLVGFAVSVPDYNQVFKKIPGGRLLPWGWWHLLTGRKHINRVRIVILGVLPQWRGLGIDWCLYAKIASYAKEKHLKSGEACYVMQDNTAMNKMMKALGAKIVKEYKLFERTI